MRQIGEIARAASGSQPSRGSGGKTPQPSQVMAKFWLRMTEVYGHKWTSAHGDEPTELWSMGLSALSMDDLKAGIRACMTSGDAWPPSLPQFLALCKPPKRENEAMYRWAGPALPQKMTDEQKARGRDEIAKLKGML